MFASTASDGSAAPPELSLQAAEADDALARLDERLRHSPLRDGWLARTHILDAKASIALDGDLVSLEDLVLHDACMNIRAPTPELIRAHEVLRARRRIAAATPGWALETSAPDILLGRVKISELDLSPDQPAAAAAGWMTNSPASTH